MREVESAKKAYEALTAATRETFPRHGIRALTKSVDWDKLRTWSLQRVSVLQPEQEAQRTSGRLVDELYWSFVDLQIALCHVLFVHDTGALHPGVNQVQVNAVELPDLKTEDGLFLFYVSVTWEQVYRVWSRFENILRFMFFGETSRPPKGTRFDLEGILKRMEVECPLVTTLPEYTSLKGLLPDRQTVATRRNRASHGESSPFHAILQSDIQISEIFQPSGLPSFTLKLTYPDPAQTIQELVEGYRKIDGPWGTTILRFMDAASRTRPSA